MSAPELSEIEARALEWAASMFANPKASTNLDKGVAALVIAVLKLARENGRK